MELNQMDSTVGMYDASVTINLCVWGNNLNHARRRLEELLKDRIHIYRPDEPNTADVIGCIDDTAIHFINKREYAKSSEGSQEHSKTESEEGSLQFEAPL
jgi:hypothetical protein